MKLSAIIIEYRERMNISQREFARRCDLSNSYISFIEKETNPKTGKPMAPTIEQYKKIADGMGITLQALFEKLDDDSPVNIHAPAHESFVPQTPEARIVSSAMDQMPQADREKALNLFKAVYSDYMKKAEDKIG